MLVSYQLSQGDSWLICFHGCFPPSLTDGFVSWCTLRVAVDKLRSLAGKSPFGGRTISPAAGP